MKLSLKIADIGGGENCELCGEWTEFDAGPILTPATSWELVCESCGLRHEPELMAAASLLRAAEKLAIETLGGQYARTS